MDINNDLQQINTFVKGMNTDVSDALMDSSQYRYAENVRLATNKDENTGELRLIEGTDIYANLSNYGEIIAMTSIRDLLVVITKKEDKNYILVNNTKNPSYWKAIFNSVDGDTLFGNHISLVTRWENSKDVKLYIADTQHGLSYINLITGESSSAIQGFDNIEANKNVSLYNIQASISQSRGNLPPVKLQYAYRLYKEGGTSTSISPLSNIIVLYDTNKPYPSGYDTITEKSAQAVDLSVETNPDTSLNYMQVYRIAYKQVGQQPEINLIYDGQFSNNITDTGINIGTSISFEEFISLIYYHVSPTIIESKGDYMFAANVKYEQDEVDYILKDKDFRIYSTGDYNGETKLSYNGQFSDILNYDVSYWMKKDNPSVEGGSGTYIDWQPNIQYIYVTKTNEKFSDSSLQNRIYDQCRSLRQGEVYRYGAILYDSEGKKSSVKWLCDIMAPVLTGNRGVSSILVNNEVVAYRIPIIGITFTVKQLPAGFSGVEIVRCDRTRSDKINILQGIAGFPYKLQKKQNMYDQEFKDYNDICAPYIISTNHFIFNSDDGYTNDGYALSKAESDNSILVIACPEYTYQSDDVSNLRLDNNTRIQAVKSIYTSSKEATNLDWMHVEDATPRFISNKSNHWTVTDDGKWFFDYIAAFLTINNVTTNLYTTYKIPNVSLYDISYKINQTDVSNVVSNVLNVAYTKSPDYNQFLTDNKSINYLNSKVSIGNNKSYINWSIPLLYGINDGEVQAAYDYHEDNISHQKIQRILIHL